MLCLQPYIVYLGSHSHGPNPSSADMDSATNSHYDFLSSLLGSKEKAKEAMIYSYNKHINGFAALLEDEEADEIKKKGNVVSVFLSKVQTVHTTRSWEFLGQERNGKVKANSAWVKARFGQNTIIGVIDTGVWPESKSFNDIGYSAVPSKWRGGSTCQINNLPALSNKTLCNRKLLAAKVFLKGYESGIGKVDPLHHRSARDIVGHGTHTMSTAGGNFVKDVSVLKNGNGTAKGGSPRARLAAYKACWNPSEGGGCHETDILSAFDEAISDGVDVISVSINGHVKSPEDLFTDGISIGSFHAVAKGIVVVCSGGNEGPEDGTVSNVAPWLFTVAASSIDRDFNDNITLGNGQRIKGTSINAGTPNGFATMIRGGDARLPNVTYQDADLCLAGTLDPNKVKGKLLICQRGRSIRPVDKGLQATLAGAVGMILENDKQSGHTVTADPHLCPTSGKDNNTDPSSSYYSHNKNPLAMLDNGKTFLGIRPAPVIASFSSRGPNVIQPSILKPDVTAPGLNIIAAYSYMASPTNLLADTRRFNYSILSGTSMACPHVSGIAALLKTRHPNWSPAAIKSAIMTTATTLDNTNKPILDGVNYSAATPFAYGSGHVRPNQAIDPGLIYDLTPSDYLNFLCASAYKDTLVSSFNYNKPYKCPKSYRMQDFNYPSITLSSLGVDPVSVNRVVTNVGPPSSTYSVSVQAPDGVKVVVQPKSLNFKKIGEKKKFRVVLQAMSDLQGQPSNSSFGALVWSDGKHTVRSPIVIVRFENSEPL
ncbi:subtilisin-like protease [Senna tora]|uniref:Subtilisin-like protease n=1 Tax=Senna tora TaxID=362788 RepID=A0A834WFY3_9FABA|nr:subtilisin-like protease [Senna tora]